MKLTFAAVSVWIACGALRFARPAALEHDEARYAISARARLAGEQRWTYVPLGIDAIAMAPFVVGACP
jgi:hypothetical protein